MTTVARTPAERAAHASACAWFPADTVTTPRARAAASKPLTAFRAPRALNEPVFCKFSHLRKRVTPTGSPTRAAESVGVTWTRPAMRSRAARIVESVSGVSWVRIEREFGARGREGRFRVDGKYTVGPFARIAIH